MQRSGFFLLGRPVAEVWIRFQPHPRTVANTPSMWVTDSLITATGSAAPLLHHFPLLHCTSNYGSLLFYPCRRNLLLLWPCRGGIATCHHLKHHWSVLSLPQPALCLPWNPMQVAYLDRFLASGMASTRQMCWIISLINTVDWLSHFCVEA